MGPNKRVLDLNPSQDGGLLFSESSPSENNAQICAQSQDLSIICL